MSKTIAQTYRLLDEIEHVLVRPSMYIGSIKPHTCNVWILHDGLFEKEEITYNPGFIKLFDEIISNSVDEHKKTRKIDTIKVTVTDDTVSVWDNGGIPVVMHPDHKIYVPELIFGNLRAGSSFNDDESRNTAGVNGVGASLTNIYSKKFVVDTCDGKKHFVQTFTDNMGNRTKAKVTDGSKGFTEITYVPDLKRFELTKIDESHVKMMRKRVIDIAGANPGLKLEFNGEKFRFKTFKEYVDLYVKDSIWEKSKDWEISMGVSNDGYQAVSFVNSIETKDGGTHEQYILNQVIDYLRAMIKKKYKVEVKPSEIRNHVFLFINCTVINPLFDSQTKEKLKTEPKDFGTKHEISEKFAKLVFASEVIQSLLDWIEQKKQAEERAELRKLNKNLDTTRVLKLIDAKSKDRSKCTIGLFEGQSAISAVRKFRDPQTFGAFPLRGKFINVSEMTNSEVIQNKEVIELIASLGLKLGEEPKDLRYDKILIYTDADSDGNHIAATLMNFFDKYWPELFEQGRIYKVMTPLVVAKKGKEVKAFYTNEEFAAWEQKTATRGWETEYKKGLAALEDVEYKEIIHNPVTVKITNDHRYKQSLEDWFGADPAVRKEKLLELSK